MVQKGGTYGVLLGRIWYKRGLGENMVQKEAHMGHFWGEYGTKGGTYGGLLGRIWYTTLHVREVVPQNWNPNIIHEESFMSSIFIIVDQGQLSQILTQWCLRVLYNAFIWEINSFSPDVECENY